MNRTWTLLLPSGVLVAGFVLAGAVGGCESTQPEASPTPVVSVLEPYEDWRWKGWLDYADELVQVHVLTYFDLFAARDGLFCGRFVQYWGYSGAYLAVNDGTQWWVIVDVPEGEYQGWGSQGRAYGTVTSSLRLDGWLDGTSQEQLDAIDPTVEPEMEPGAQFLTVQLLSSESIYLDILPLTLGDLIGYATREGATPSSGTEASLPLEMPLDFASYELYHSGPVTDQAEEMEAAYCTYCKEPGDDDPALTGVRRVGRTKRSLP